MQTTPYLEVDLDRLAHNLTSKTAQLKAHGIAHRPHIKTHKSTLLGKMQLEAGVSGITASKLGEAEVFFNAGFDNILIAYNLVGRDKLARYADMHRERSLLTTVDSAFIAEGLSDVGLSTGKKVRVLVELNLGENRCGVRLQEVSDFALLLRRYEGLEVAGAMAYHGAINRCSNEADIISAVKEERDALLHARSVLQKAGHPASITSSGSTVASCYPTHLAGVTESRSGSYVFGDVSTLTTGALTLPECALFAVATVISLPAPDRATLDLGSKVLSSDRADRGGFGLIVDKPSAEILSLNEEHAMVQCNNEAFELGERVRIIPNHTCVAINLAPALYGFQKGTFVRTFPVEARGLYR